MTVYDELSGALKSVLDKKQDTRLLQRGQLGYVVDGRYQVRSSTDNTQYYVRLDNKSFITAYHNNVCQPVPDLHVYFARIEGEGKSQYELVSVDYDLLKETAPNNAGNILAGPHTHDRFSGMAFPIDSRLLSSFQIRVVNNLNVYVNSGAYSFNGQWRWFSGDSINLAPYLPTTPNRQKWIALVLNEETSSITVIEFPQQSLTSPLTMGQLETIRTTGIPLGAVRLKHGQTSLIESDMEALHTLADKTPKHNFNATSNPNASNDSTQGYSVGSTWINAQDELVWTCIDNTQGNANWVVGGESGVDRYPLQLIGF